MLLSPHSSSHLFRVFGRDGYESCRFGDFTCSEKRRARLKKAAKQLSDEDLAMVLLENNGARSWAVSCKAAVGRKTSCHICLLHSIFIAILVVDAFEPPLVQPSFPDIFRSRDCRDCPATRRISFSQKKGHVAFNLPPAWKGGKILSQEYFFNIWTNRQQLTNSNFLVIINAINVHTLPWNWPSHPFMNVA